MKEAVEKIRAEMDTGAGPYYQLIGEFLIQQIENYEGAAEKIIAADKTIAGSLKEMTAEAKKKAVNGMAMLTDQEGYAIILKYFGIEGDPLQVVSVQNTATEPKKKKPSKKVVQFPGQELIQTTLDDFMGEEAFE